VVISISDTGIGIPKAFHDTLFEKFTSARRRGLKGEVSTGLGMSIIKTIVEWHGGSIWFNSEENVGTTFFIEIPKL
jgi:two-component system sensor histidine kinase VicK